MRLQFDHQRWATVSGGQLGYGTKLADFQVLVKPKGRGVGGREIAATSLR